MGHVEQPGTGNGRRARRLPRKWPAIGAVCVVGVITSCENGDDLALYGPDLRDAGLGGRSPAKPRPGSGDAGTPLNTGRDAASAPIEGGLHASGQDAGSALGRVSVLTQHNDLARTGANLDETELTAKGVASSRFQRLFTRQVDDQIYAQPLLVSGLDVPGVGRRDVLVVATVNDSVYAFDADDPNEPDPLWMTSFLGPATTPVRNTDMTGACSGHYTDFSGNIGVVGTPVIDRDTETLYVVGRTAENGKFVQRLHALRLTDGGERAGSPVVLTATVAGTGEGGTTLTFDPLHENQRPGLLLLGGVVYIGWAGHCDWGPYHGWLMGYDAATLAQVVVYNVTPNGNAGGIWQSGQAPSSDGKSLFVISGNGTVGNGPDPRSLVGRGESFMKLERSAGSSLEVKSWFTPFDYPALESGDLDLGSAGMLLIPGTHLAVSGGKAGILYVVDRDDMGGLTTSKTTDDNVIQTFPLNTPQNIHGSPVWWGGPNSSAVYVWGDNDDLKAFPFLGASYTPGTPVLDVEHVRVSSVGVHPSTPGAMLSVSANGNAHGTGIVWASHSLSGNANQVVRAGILRAFDAETLDELWNNQTNAARDDCGQFAKFSCPTVANGKVYLASFSNQVCVYGLGD